MAVTPEFKSAVSEKNLLRVRIMLKDSLLVDKTFCQFEEMRTYAENQGVNFWMAKTEELEKAPNAEWNLDLMNLELAILVNDFTKERLVYCKSIIEKVYGSTPHITQPYVQKTNFENKQYAEQSQNKIGGKNVSQKRCKKKQENLFQYIIMKLIECLRRK